MGRTVYKTNPRVTAIFEDLEQFLRFCQDFGYRFNEADLYNWRSYSYQQFNKHLQGKFAKNMWTIDWSKKNNTR